MENKIDLSPEALQKRREIAEKIIKTLKEDYYWKTNKDKGHQINFTETGDIFGMIEIYPRYIEEYDRCVLCANHIAANSPDAVIAMIDEIERLRSENHALKMEVQRLQIYEDDLK